MVVADASAVVEMLLATPRGGAIAEHLFKSGHPTVGTHLLDIEVLHVIRRFNRTAARAEQRWKTSEGWRSGATATSCCVLRYGDCEGF